MNPSHDARAPIPGAELEQAADDLDAIRVAVASVVHDADVAIDLLIAGLLASGHVLLEGVPGVAKTTLARTFARTIDVHFGRVQFTPDLLPTDITGTYVLDLSTNEFDLRAGPIFANIVLGDEINRAPAKTQSALLEAMQERQVTIDGTTHELPDPFLVIATQNPVEQEGVYLLPEAQLDRFLLKVEMSYPAEEAEVGMLGRHGAAPPRVSPVVGATRVRELIALATRIDVSLTIRRYIVALARKTRQHASVVLGASPRASLALLRAARAHALMDGRDYVNVDDVRRGAVPVFAHRVMLQSSAIMSGATEREIVEEALRTVPYDPS